MLIKQFQNPARILNQWVILSIIFISLYAGMASAGSLQELRASGALGESYNGYVVARKPAAKSEAATINKKRKALYAKKAAAKGVSVDQVAGVYASEILKKIPTGTWVQNKQGGWSQK